MKEGGKEPVSSLAVREYVSTGYTITHGRIRVSQEEKKMQSKNAAGLEKENVEKKGIPERVITNGRAAQSCILNTLLNAENFFFFSCAGLSFPPLALFLNFPGDPPVSAPSSSPAPP